MSAREMFEELGYTAIGNMRYEQVYFGDHMGDDDNKYIDRIDFIEPNEWTDNGICAETEVYDYFKHLQYSHTKSKTITPNEFKAIQKQIEELGWEK